MVTSKKALEKIKKIIEKGYNRILLTVLGRESLSEEALDQLAQEGIDLSNEDSLLDLVYFNNVLNDLNSPNAPTSIPEMKAQQAQVPTSELHTTASEHINESFASVTNKLKSQVQAQIEGIIRSNNMAYRGNGIQNQDRPDNIDQLVKESTLGELKKKLREYATDDVATNWDRIAVTETANAIGLGSVDRVVKDNPEADADEVYCFRIPVNDQNLCLRESELVITANMKSVPVGELKIGDELRNPAINKDSRRRNARNRVTNLAKKKATVYKYTLEDGRTLECTEDHPILIRLPKHKNIKLFMPIGELEKALIPYEICEWGTMSVGDRGFLSRRRKLFEDFGYDDTLYFWIEKKAWIIEQLEKGLALRNIFKSTEAVELVSILCRLAGIEPRSFDKKSLKNNSFNREYLTQRGEDREKALNSWWDSEPSTDTPITQYSKELIGTEVVVEIELEESSNRAYVSENGIISHNCKFCRKFYLDEDQSPAVYKLSTLLNNGTNYGKKASDWKPVATATHPNDRESGVIQLKPGWKVVAGGRLEYIGLDGWDKYIQGKLRE